MNTRAGFVSGHDFSEDYRLDTWPSRAHNPPCRGLADGVEVCTVDGWRNYAAGLAVNLIAAAIAYKIGGKNPALMLCGTGFLLMLIVFLAGKKKEELREKGDHSPSVTDSFKQSITGTEVNAPITANPVQTIEQHFHVPTTQIIQGVQPSLKANNEVKPNIKFVRTFTQRVGITDLTGVFFIPTREFDSDNPLAALACFRNEPQGTATIPDAYNVRAQILYKDQNDNEIDDIPSARWIDQRGSSVSLTLGTTKCLILMLMVKNGKLLVPWNGDRFTEFRIGQISTIEVRLISKNTVLLSSRFSFADDNGSIDALMLP